MTAPAPARAHRSQFPYVEDGRIPWGDLTARQRTQVRRWLDELHIGLVPTDGLVEFDETYGEWRIEVFAIPDGRPRPDEHGDPRRVILRRFDVDRYYRHRYRQRDLRRSPIVNVPSRVEFAGVDITEYLATPGLEHRRIQP